jgi:hypothetical protein
MANERGLVVSGPIKLSGEVLSIGSTDLDPQELRFALLFWDKLNLPTNNIFRYGLSPDSQFLAGAGILSRIDVQVPFSGGMAESFRRAHVDAFHLLDRQEPGVWSLATGERSISFLDEELEVGRGALVRLYQAIPVPDKDVALQDILEFRTKRRSELLALRHHLEAIYQRIFAAGDGELALRTEVETLEQAITNYIRASKESRFSFRMMSFDASLNLNVGVAVAAGLVAYGAGFGTVGALLSGIGSGVGAGIKFGPGVSLKARNATPTPFRYISSYHGKLF